MIYDNAACRCSGTVGKTWQTEKDREEGKEGRKSGAPDREGEGEEGETERERLTNC